MPSFTQPYGGGGLDFSTLDPTTWRNTSENAIDAFRHFGATSGAALLPLWTSQLSDLPAGMENQRMARGAITQMATPQGREQNVQNVARNRTRQAYQSGKRMREMMLQQGQNVSGAATQLAAMNQAGRDINQFRADQESPANLMQIYQAVNQANSPQEILSILAPLLQLDQQDLPRALQYLQQEQQNSQKGGLFGNIVGSVLGGMDWASILK